ncbi:MAG: hypothetical protein JXB38_02300 [Anaerolineales bacterium]|nr:hypothetical protein [Anaerolineales bacterium]
MSVTVIIHIANEDPIVGEMEDLPSVTDTLLFVQNPRRRDGKDIHYLQNEVTSVIWPMERIAFIEIMPSEEDESIITPWRE